MAKTTIPFDTVHFLQSMRHRSFAFVGVAMLLRAHLVAAVDNRLTRDQVYELFRVGTGTTRSLVDDVMDLVYREDHQQRIYSPAIDRAMCYPEQAGQAM